MTLHKLRIALAAILVAAAAVSAVDSASAGYLDGRYGYFIFDGGFGP
jgi:hypothetical protein